MDFVNDINHDEIRSGFLVKSDRKKLWNVQLGIYNEFRRVCEKYNLRYFATWGTLLGAVRHKGFIPWDDDMDFSMFRPDYEKLKSVAHEFKYPYFFDLWYKNEDKDLEKLEGNAGYVVAGPVLRIHDERTSAIYPLMEKKDKLHQGILIDVTPLDPIPLNSITEISDYQFTDDRINSWFMIMELLRACFGRDDLVKELKDPNKFSLIPKKDLLQICSLPLKQRGELFENFCAETFYNSEYVFDGIYVIPGKNQLKTKHFRDVTYLPFENIQLPVPIDYEDVLTEMYGDWHKFVIDSQHCPIFSVDIPYNKFFEDCKYINI